MKDLNQLPISPTSFPLQSAASGMESSSKQMIKTGWHRPIVMIAAWIEIVVGISFFFAFNIQSQFLFGATPEGMSILWARFAGIALIGFGVACLPSDSAEADRSAGRNLLVFNITATIFFAWVAVATTFQGVLLWSVVILHAVISIALALSLRHEGSLRH